MRTARDEAFTEYVAARLPWLSRVAYLLCQDRSRAEDLVQTAITRLYVHWRRAAAADNMDGYVRAILVRVYLSDQRTAWSRRVTVTAAIPDEVAGVADLEAHMDLRAALSALAPRQRAVVVLRYYCDLSVDETAAVLGCSAGTVKSQTARGLDALRRLVVSPSGFPVKGTSSP